MAIFMLSFQNKTATTELELQTTCKMLAKLTSNAIDKNRKDKVAIYYNAYKALREENNFTNNCDNYFNQVKESYGTYIGTWTIQSDYPPKKVITPGNGGGFTHHEVELMEKIKAFNLSEKDIQELLLLKDLKNGHISREQLKNLNVEEYKSLFENIKPLDSDKIDPANLNNLTNPSYNIEEFKKEIKIKQ